MRRGAPDAHYFTRIFVALQIESELKGLEGYYIEQAGVKRTAVSG